MPVEPLSRSALVLDWLEWPDTEVMTAESRTNVPHSTERFEFAEIADEFMCKDFSDDELEAIRQTRRTTPR